MRNTLAALVLTLLLPACFLSRRAVNVPLDPSRLATLEPGVTTALEVVERLGAPTEVVQLGRASAYRYDHSATKRAGLFLVVIGFLNEDTRSDRVWLFFDDAGLLSHAGATFEASDIQWAMPWADVYEAD